MQTDDNQREAQFFVKGQHIVMFPVAWTHHAAILSPSLSTVPWWLPEVVPCCVVNAQCEGRSSQLRDGRWWIICVWFWRDKVTKAFTSGAPLSNVSSQQWNAHNCFDEQPTKRDVLKPLVPFVCCVNNESFPLEIILTSSLSNQVWFLTLSAWPTFSHKFILKTMPSNLLSFKSGVIFNSLSLTNLLTQIHFENHAVKLPSCHPTGNKIQCCLDCHCNVRSASNKVLQTTCVWFGKSPAGAEQRAVVIGAVALPSTPSTTNN